MKPLYHRHRWCDDEVEYLRENYGEQSVAYIAADLGRTIHSVYHMAERLGLRQAPGQRHRRLDRRARDLHQCQTWWHWMNERRRVRASWLWPGCRSAAEAQTCRLLREAGAATAAELAARRGVKPGTQQKVLARLHADDMVVRTEEVTPAGRTRHVYALREAKVGGIGKALDNLEKAAGGYTPRGKRHVAAG